MLTEQQMLLLDAAVTPRKYSPREELRHRLNLELQGYQVLDIPVTKDNRAYWRTVWDAQHEDPVYA